MKKRFSLLLAIVMVIAMVLPMLPMLSVPTVAAESAGDIVAEIYVEDATTPAVTIKRSEFATLLPQNSASNIFKTNDAIKGKNVTFKFVSDMNFDSDVQIEFVATAGKTVTVDGNGHTLTKTAGGSPLIRVRTQGTAGGTVTFKNLNYNCSTTLVQYYGSQTINIENCVWVNTAAGGRGIANNGAAAGSVVNLKSGSVLVSASNAAIDTAWGGTEVATWNVETGSVLMTNNGTGNVINNTHAGLTVNVNGGAIIGNVKSTAGTVNLNSGYMSGTATGATVAEGFVQNAVAGVGAKGYTTIDAALAAVTASATDATVVVAKDATIKAGVTFTTTKNITIKGYNDPTITIAKDDGTGVGNVFVLNGAGMTLTLDGVNLTGNAAGSNNNSSCIFQIHSKAANAVLNLKNVDMKDLTAKWFIVNIMGNDGNTRTVNVENCTSTNIGVAMFRTGNPAGSAGKDHCNHSVINITDSDLQCNSNVVSGSNGSTAAVVIKNSKLTSTGGHVVDLVAPTNLVANSDSAKIGITTCYYDEASVFTPKSGSKGINAPVSDKVVVGVIEATYQEGDGEVEYVSLQGALTKASSATKDVTINLYKDATLTHTSPIVMNGTGNVTVNGDLGNGSVAKITYTGKTNMIRWNATGKTLAFKNVDMDIDCSNACVFQLSHQTGGTTNLTLENVDMTAKIYWHIINSMVSDGGTPIVNIINSNLEVTAAGDPSTGSIVSTGNDNAHPQKLDLNVSGSTLRSDTIVISNGKSSVDANFVDSDLIATELDAIRVWGDVSGSKIVMDSASTITVPAGKKALAVTAPGATVNTPYDVVFEVYDTDTGDLLDTVLRKEINDKMGETGWACGGRVAHVQTNAGHNITIEQRADFTIENTYALCLNPNGGKTVTYNGNGYTYYNNRSDGGRAMFINGNGTLKLNGVKIITTSVTPNGCSIGQFYSGATVIATDCEFTSAGHKGFYLTGKGTLKLEGNTKLTVKDDAIFGQSTDVNTVIVGENVVIEAVTNAINLGSSGTTTVTVNGTVKSTSANAININNAKATVTVDGATLNGNVTVTAGAIDLTDTTVNGIVTVKSGTNLTMNGGKVEATGITFNIEGTATVTGAEIIGNGGSGSTTIRVAGTLTMTDTTVIATANDLGAVYMSGGTLVANNCTVTANSNSTFGAMTDNTTHTAAMSITVNGGKYTALGTTADKVIYGNSAAATVTINNAEIIGNDRVIVVKDGVGTHYMSAGDKVALEGAEIRLRNDYTNGLRFVNVISKDLVDSLKALAAGGQVNYGTIVLPKEYLTKYSLTVVTHKTLADIAVVDIPAANGLTVDADGNVVISSALVEIKGSHYDWEFISVVYASYTDANGDTVYVYGDNTAETLVAKSVKSVAEAALADTQEEAGGDYRFPYNGAYTKYSPSKIKVLEAFTGIGEMPVAPEKPVTPPEVHKHTYTENVTAPTCFEPGYTTYTCACGFSYTGAETDPKHDAITHVAASAATCTENGNIEYWFCETCGDAWLDEECLRNTNLKAVVLPSAGHVDANEDYKCDGCSTKMLPEADSYLTVKQAIAVAKAAGSSYTTDKYFVTGIVTNVYNTQYGNMYLKDDAGNELGVYGLYTWDKAVRYDAMPYKPVEGDELVIYTVLGTYNSNAQGKDAWMDDVVAHEHTANPATCTDPSVCTICGATLAPANGHTFVDGTCACGATEDSAKTYSYKFPKQTFTANGTKDLNGVNWTLDGDGGYWGWDSNNGKGQQFGSGSKPYKKMILTSADFNDVSKIVINTSGASSINGTLVVTVGGVKVGEIKLTTTATAYTFTCDEPLDGPIVLTYTQSSSKALYILSIEVTYK